ncbi:MAG: hypothetical protein ABEI96_04980 [Haloarculaceae archaeon]
MGEEDIALDEKRLFGTRREVSVAYVAGGLGVATVAVSGDQIGRFRLEHRCRATDAAGADGRLAVATDDDVLVATEEGFVGTDFGAATAVGLDDGVVAAAPDGEVARLVDDDWRPLGTMPDVRAIDGDVLAAADGVYRASADGLAGVGLNDVRDVASGGDLPLAATGDGLYYLGNGWMTALDGSFDVVATDGDRAHAVAADGTCYERVGDSHATFEGGQEWVERPRPVDERVVDVAYGESPYAVTADGTFLVDADPETTPDGAGGWRTRSLGLSDVVALAVP